jgi:hypothetical protein
MAWEKRCRSLAYYRSVRTGDKVTKVYCGRGKAGEKAAREDAERRAARAAAREALLAERRAVEAISAETRRFQGICELISDALMVMAGYHRPFRARWRLRR